VARVRRTYLRTTAAVARHRARAAVRAGRAAVRCRAQWRDMIPLARIPVRRSCSYHGFVGGFLLSPGASDCTPRSRRCRAVVRRRRPVGRACSVTGDDGTRRGRAGDRADGTSRPKGRRPMSSPGGAWAVWARSRSLRCVCRPWVLAGRHQSSAVAVGVAVSRAYRAWTSTRGTPSRSRVEVNTGAHQRRAARSDARARAAGAEVRS
jgi:hypothetical protein